MKSLEENYAQFKKLKTTAFGIGVDSAPSNKAWAKSLGIKKTALLCDFWPHGKVAKLYGVFRDKDGFSLIYAGIRKQFSGKFYVL